MKLVVQIPCLDEAGTPPLTLADLRRDVAGFDAVEVLVVDDGSRDGTGAIARAHGGDHVDRGADIPAPVASAPGLLGRLA